MKILREAGLVYGEKYGYHTHYLPTQEAADFLSDTFEKIQQLSRQVDRDMTACQCEFRKEVQHEETN